MADDQVFDEFVDDFFAECDEHLAAIRRLVLALEARPQGGLEPAELQELARRLHTMKGLSGMVALTSAEEVSHAIEDLVRTIQPLRPLAPQMLDALFAGVGLLDRCVQSKRVRHEPPSHEDYVRRARELAGGITPSRALVTTPAVSVRRADAALYRFEFTPSAAQVARGIGVELIRRRLHEAGEIVRTTPRVQDGGAVTFEFIVRLHDAPPPAEWAADGLRWELAPEAEPGRVVPVEMPVDLTSQGSTNVVRVELSRVDDLMRMIGEMVVLRSRLDDSLRQGDGAHAWDDLRETNIALERQLRALREGVMRIRLVPVGEVFERMRFALRDVIRESGKTIQLEFSGQDTQIDKLIVDRMLEPLLHLVRNAAAHGIESRDERVARGKPAEGRVALRARAAGDRIVLEAEDDGAGIDVERVRRRATEAGLLAANAPLAEDALLDVICSPGFSTREAADLGSGRGVGMAVVRSAIRTLGGELSLSTIPGAGTRFTIELPLTLMIADALLVEVGGQVMAVPQLALREILQLDPSSVTAVEHGEVISYRGGVLPLVTLHRVFGMRPAEGTRPHVLVVGSETQLSGLVVDRLIGLREIVVHPVNDPLIAMPGIAAATELADGRISLILDVAALVKRAREQARLRRQAPAILAGAVL